MFSAFGTTNALMLSLGAGLVCILGDVFGVVPMLDIVAALYISAALIAMLKLRDQSDQVRKEKRDRT